MEGEKILWSDSRRACLVGLTAALLLIVFVAGCAQRAAQEPSNHSPSATAMASPTSGPAPLLVNFTGSGSDPDGSIATYSWAFGDGGVISGQSPTHSYKTPGTYMAVLTVTDDKGAIGVAELNITVGTTGGNQPPVAGVSASPTSGLAPLAVSFIGTGNDPDGSIASYAWTFGDGGASALQNPSHTYAGAGSYVATLTVTDNKGATGSATVTITATAPGANQPPTASASASPTYGTVPLTVFFTGSGTDADGSIASYSWSFGDGGSSSQQNPTYSYPVAGSYTARLAVTDNQGATGSATVAITVAAPNQNLPPAASASAVPVSGKVPLSVSFTGTGTDPDGAVASYAWTFGDGGTSVLQNPSHTYTTAGSFTARLTVTDNQGATGSATVDIMVLSNQPPTATASATPTSGNAPLAVSFTGSGTDPDGTIASYAWTFGDGGTSTSQNPSHTYTTVGSYTARLTVTDNQGATGSATVVITAGSSNHAPVANAGPDQINLDPGVTVSLAGTGSSDPDGNPLTYQWVQTAGPSVTLSGASTATPSFPTPRSTTATYTFTLTVTDNGSPALNSQDTVNVSIQVTYVNTTKALIDSRGNQPNGTRLGCTASGCHVAGGSSLSPLTTYAEVYSARARVKSKIAAGASMRKYLLTGEPEIITAWIDNAAPQNNP